MMVKHRRPYTEQSEDEYLKRQQQRHLARLKKQTAQFGFELVPQTPPASQAETRCP
jgi:hypothetical protein